MKILSDLFIVFFKIGLFTFGGGYAMLALIEDICVEKKKWITDRMGAVFSRTKEDSVVFGTEEVSRSLPEAGGHF